MSDVYNAIQLMLAPVYINNFIYEDRVKRVMVQADAAYRMDTDSLSHVYTPSSLTTSTTSSSHHQLAQRSIQHDSAVQRGAFHVEHGRAVAHALQRLSGHRIVGDANKGYSTGQAMGTLQNIVDSDLPKGFGADWTGQSYQELLAGNSATLLMILSIVIVFLCLSALYESWSIPVAVLLVVPLGLLGMVAASMLRGFPNDMYFKIGMVTVIGPSCEERDPDRGIRGGTAGRRQDAV